MAAKKKNFLPKLAGLILAILVSVVVLATVLSGVLNYLNLKGAENVDPAALADAQYYMWLMIIIGFVYFDLFVIGLIILIVVRRKSKKAGFLAAAYGENTEGTETAEKAEDSEGTAPSGTATAAETEETAQNP